MRAHSIHLTAIVLGAAVGLFGCQKVRDLTNAHRVPSASDGTAANAGAPPAPANETAMTPEVSSIEADREAAATNQAERLTELDNWVTDIRAQIDQLPDRASYGDALAELKLLRMAAQSAIDAIRDVDLRLDDARDAADDQITAFETAIDALQTRVDHDAQRS